MDHYWEVVKRSVQIFGRFYVGIHLIVGLGETEKEMIFAIQKGQDAGVLTHLFSFFPKREARWKTTPSPSHAIQK